MKEAHHKASEWFDDLYNENRDSQENIPWARHDVNPLLQTYLEDQIEHQGKALVIGCGLGDDARALEIAGYEVVAIDVSTTALELAQEKFPDSNITFEKQDIFDMPQKYDHYFDFVFEAFTIQSLPIEFREKMIKAVANTVAKNGRLLLVAHKRQTNFDGPPWPLEDHEVSLFKEEGLVELSYDIHTEESKVSNTKYRVLYSK